MVLKKRRVPKKIEDLIENLSLIFYEKNQFYGYENFPWKIIFCF